MKRHQVLARKYRPQTFLQIIGQKFVVQTLQNALRYNKTAHAYLFCGPRGVGKTTIARIFAKALNCPNLSSDFEPCNNCNTCIEITNGQSLDVIEIDGASNRGIDDIRQINDTVGYAPAANYKIYIIDEVHMLTKEAFNALLKTLEEPPQKVKFFFATTEPHKVLPTILSRCQRFDLKRVSGAEIQQKLASIASDLNRSAQEDALSLIATYAEGSLRDAESIFEQILCFEEEMITTKTVQEALGLMPKEKFFTLDKAVYEEKIPYAFEMAEEIFQKGLDPAYFLEELIEHYRNILVCKFYDIPALSSEYIETAKNYRKEQCLFLLEYLMQMMRYFGKSLKKVTLEMILLKILQSKNQTTLSDLFQRLIHLEDGGQNRQNLNPAPSSIDSSADKENIKQIEKPIQAPSQSEELRLVEVPFHYEAQRSFSTDSSFSDYETLMRFAAVELEGSLRIEKRRENNG